MSCQYQSKNGGFHVGIDRKNSINAPANPQIFSYRQTILNLGTHLKSDRQTIFRIASLLRKVTSDFQTIFNPGIFLEK